MKRFILGVPYVGNRNGEGNMGFFRSGYFLSSAILGVSEPLAEE
jgi:hypothetical protein